MNHHRILKCSFLLCISTFYDWKNLKRTDTSRWVFLNCECEYKNKTNITRHIRSRGISAWVASFMLIKWSCKLLPVAKYNKVSPVKNIQTKQRRLKQTINKEIESSAFAKCCVNHYSFNSMLNHTRNSEYKLK